MIGTEPPAGVVTPDIAHQAPPVPVTVDNKPNLGYFSETQNLVEGVASKLKNDSNEKLKPLGQGQNTVRVVAEVARAVQVVQGELSSIESRPAREIVTLPTPDLVYQVYRTENDLIVIDRIAPSSDRLAGQKRGSITISQGQVTARDLVSSTFERPNQLSRRPERISTGGDVVIKKDSTASGAWTVQSETYDKTEETISDTPDVETRTSKASTKIEYSGTGPLKVEATVQYNPTVTKDHY